MMTFHSSVGALLALVLLHGCTGTKAKAVDIGDCDDLQAAASSSRKGRVEGKLTTTYISCPEWTSIDITKNQLKLVPGGDLTDEDTVTFFNVRFVVSSTLNVEFPARFDGDSSGDDETSRKLNGGVFFVEKGGRAEFLYDVYVDEIGVDTGVTDAADISPDAGRGGCFYNEGRLKFHQSFETNGCSTFTGKFPDATIMGDGGTIWNGETGRITFKDTVNLACGGVGQYGESRGGAIYNAGKIDFYEDASFTDVCSSQAGGVIYNEGRIRFYEESFAYFSFAGSTGFGAHVFNSGNIFFRGGALHEYANAASGGGLYNSGKAIYSRGTSVKFDTCGADDFGGAIALTADSTFDLPEDTVFDRNYILNPVDDNADQCDDIYLETKTGYTCLTSWP